MRFTATDADILYSFPRSACKLAKIVWYFTFIQRAAPPTYEELVGCFNRGLNAGIIRRDGKLFAIEDDWYARIHQADETVANEIESLLEFAEWFVNADFPIAERPIFDLTPSEYQAVLATLPQK
jgi:hypothetical protein